MRCKKVPLMTHVDNWAGNLKGTVRVAESKTGGVYPVGSVLQLVPTECDATHGCAPIPITIAMSGALQRTDPRCRNRPSVSAEDTAALAQLAEILKGMAAASAAKK
jgi:hypothetical protein